MTVTAAPPAHLADAAALSLRVQPAGAVIEIDGEPWDAPVSGTQLVVHVTPGVHRVVVRAEGYDPFDSQVEVAAGDTRQLNVSLTRR